MYSYRRIPTMLLVGASIWLFLANHVLAQTHPGLITISGGSGSSQAETEAAEALVARMLDDGELVLEGSHGDSQLPGRQHEGFGQLHNGVAVYGASISKQTMGGEIVSIFGTIYADIDVNPNPTLSLGDATTRMEGVSGVAAFLQVTQPLTILPTLDGSYALAYRITASTLVTYFIDAHDGHVLMEIDEKRYQSAVGVGRGVLGDTKKVSATRVGARFEARDQLRPADIVTLDIRGSTQKLDRIIYGTVRQSDLATDADNTWTNRGIVDTHVHMGWSYDYFFKRHFWGGLNGRNATVYGARPHRSVRGAFFVRPPWGPNGRGLVAFGTKPNGIPYTALDIVAHELMHGVTHFGVSRRSAGGLKSFYHYDGLGPQGLLINGWSCSNLYLTFANGQRADALCSNGRFVLTSNHGGAIGESFADIFGTSVEFFFQQRGGGLLTADYLMGEDIHDIIRSLRRPASLFVDFTRRARYPDHYTKRLRFVVMVMGQDLFVVPLAFDGTRLVVLSSDDGGGVHWNSTILSHAFYLAIEGGRNSTSGRNVRGVGAANRAQIERVFFRAVTKLMPGAVWLPLVADVIRQAVRDLFPHGSRERRAVYDALDAVGL